jgi:hypothetical protein
MTMCDETRDHAEPAARWKVPGALADRLRLHRQPDLAQCAQWLQREGGARWRAAETALLLWVEPSADLARTHPERCAPVLAETGRLLRQRLRAVDWVLQVGTQAVVAVLFVPEAGVQAAVQRRMQQALAAPMVLDGDLVRVGLRMGAAAVAGPDADALALLELAHRRCLAA